ncbi:MAG TPA: hypothetical protein VG275_13520 [Solirubrobacteraceae bacterium]|jgi:hypothetical protein|nr:hypothetical protein [Solirubrobacteraceae bacterium]
MRRVAKTFTASLLALTALLIPAAIGAASGPPASVQARCLPRGARSLAADRTARVYSWHSAVYGCVDATGQLRKLGGAGVCNRLDGAVAPVALAAATVAYGLERCGVDTGSSTVVVLNLITGIHRADLPAATLPTGPESHSSVTSLVLRRDGAAAWIARSASLVRRRTTYEVHRFAGGKSSLLDSGGSIAPGSLRLAGSLMTWRHGMATRSARLP